MSEAPESGSVLKPRQDYVGLKPCGGKWSVEIWNPIKKRRLYLGTFRRAEDASKAYERQRQFFVQCCEAYNLGVYEDLLLAEKIAEEFDALSISSRPHADAHHVPDETPPDEISDIDDFDGGYVDSFC